MGCSVAFKYAKNVCGWGYAPDPTGGAHDALLDLLLRGRWKGEARGHASKPWINK